MGEGGGASFYPYEGGGGGMGQDLAMLKEEGGGLSKKLFGLITMLTQEFEGLAIFKGGTTCFHPLKRRGVGGAWKSLPCFEGGGGAKKSQTCNFPIT